MAGPKARNAGQPDVFADDGGMLLFNLIRIQRDDEALSGIRDMVQLDIHDAMKGVVLLMESSTLRPPQFRSIPLKCCSFASAFVQCIS